MKSKKTIAEITQHIKNINNNFKNFIKLCQK